MPELPEVETIASSLRNESGNKFSPDQGLDERPGIIGRTITEARVLWARSVAIPDVPEFLARISGQTIKGVERRGKFLLIRLENDWLIIHLRMSGDIRVEPLYAALDQPHDRLMLNFFDDTRLVFNDTRKFGRAWLVTDASLVLADLGPEPFSEELTPAVFYTMLRQRKTAIKALLLDQHFLAGMGNIYTDEALHLAGIHPLEKAAALSPQKVELLLAAIRSVLREGITRHGASIDWVYRGGDFQNYFRVYQRTNQPCPVCGTLIKRTVVGQRGTHYCPHCQALSLQSC